jgi:hypothetical protein
MPMLVMGVRCMGMRVRALFVTMRVAVFAKKGWIVGMVVMSVVVTMRVLVLHGIMCMKVRVFLGQM